MFDIRLNRGCACDFTHIRIRRLLIVRFAYWKLEGDKWELPRIRRREVDGGLYIDLGKLWIHR